MSNQSFGISVHHAFPAAHLQSPAIGSLSGQRNRHDFSPMNFSIRTVPTISICLT
jgi:hypothetical protein